MLYYIFLAIILIFSYIFINYFFKNNQKIIYLSFCFFVLSIMACFRDFSVGTDTKQFVQSYIFFKDYGFDVVNFKQVYEPGFMLYIIILSKIYPEPRFFLIVTYLFINYSIIHFISKYSKNYYFSVIIYVFSCQFLVSMCMMRQFIAISIVLLAFNLLIEKKYFKFLFFVLIATSFHYFSIVFLILIPIYMIKKIDVKYKIILFFVVLFLYIFIPNIMIFLLTNIGNYSDYISYLEELGELGGTIRIPPMVFVLFAFILPYFVQLNDSYDSEYFFYKKIDYSYLKLVYLFLFILIILSSRFGLFTRVYYYFTPFMVLLPNVICRYELDKRWEVYYTFMGLIIFLTCLMLNKGTYGTVDFSF